MQRRNFIKSTLCLGCMGGILSGCNLYLTDDKTKKYSEFVYKTEAELPKKVLLEACSICQLHCPQCPVGNSSYGKDDKTRKKQGYLKFEDFKKFVDNNNLERIELSNHGEIFLNPELNDIIKYAHKKNIALTALGGTNLNTVSEETLENLVKYKFRALSVSIDGATPETYKIYRVGGDYDRVIDNIKKINYYKEKYNSELPRLKWQFILFGHNEHEIELAKKKARELNMFIAFKNNFSPEYSPIKNKALVKKQTKDKNTTKSQPSCYLLFNSPCIDFDGTLLGCCNICYPNDFKINVFKVGLLNALNSSNVIETKRMLNDFSVKQEDSPCANCPSYMFLKNNNIPALETMS